MDVDPGETLAVRPDRASWAAHPMHNNTACASAELQYLQRRSDIGHLIPAVYAENTPFKRGMALYYLLSIQLPSIHRRRQLLRCLPAQGLLHARRFHLRLVERQLSYVAPRSAHNSIFARRSCLATFSSFRSHVKNCSGRARQ